jgi:hypothetical protein
MRRAWIVKTLAMGSVAAVATVAFAVTGNAAVQLNTVTVTKVVQGVVPANTTFTVELTCVPTGLPSETHTIHFDAKGNPTDTNSFGVLDFVTCTATETDSGGASAVSYGCSVTYGNDDQSHLSQCTSDQTVSFANEVLTDSATLTITNRFDEPSTGGTTDTTTVPEPVVIAPAHFTG